MIPIYVVKGDTRSSDYGSYGLLLNNLNEVSRIRGM